MRSAYGQALFVTFIWSMSWVFIKVGLEDIPSITFAGLRYAVAFIALVIYAFPARTTITTEVKRLTRREWGLLAVLGLIYYTITQSTQFVAIDYVPAVSVSLILNFSAVAIPILGILFLSETVTVKQWLGTLVFLVGVLIYFYPIDIPTDEVFGLGMAIASMLATSSASILGRSINRLQRFSALTVTLISMGIGSAVMLTIGLITQGLPALSWQTWALVFWLAVLHTAFPFTLWNHTLKHLSSMESGMINNTMLAQIGILAWIFFGESIDGKRIIGLIFALVGALIVSVYGQRQTNAKLPLKTAT